MKLEMWQLRQRQSLPLEVKENLSILKIIQFHDAMDGNICVSYSAGLDSTVALHLVRRIFPWVQAGFVNTGLEFYGIIRQAKNTSNVVWLKPKMIYKDIVKEIGYPVISKKVARYISDVQNPKPENENTRRLRLTGISSDGRLLKSYMIPKKYKNLIAAPFKISDKCCDILKKEPLHRYQKESGNYPIIGTRTEESDRREKGFLKTGCNIIDSKEPISKPISFWSDQDVLQYILKYNVPYAKDVYGEIVEINGKLTTTGEKRTGCQLCAFGIMKDKDRFIRLKKINPNMWAYGLKIGMGEVLDHIGIDYGGQIDLLEYIKKESPCKG